MGVFDDLKDSVTGSDKSNNSKGRHGRTSSNDMDFGSDIGSDLGDGPSGNDFGQPDSQGTPQKPGSRSQSPNGLNSQNNPNNGNRGQRQSPNGQRSQRQSGSQGNSPSQRPNQSNNPSNQFSNNQPSNNRSGNNLDQGRNQSQGNNSQNFPNGQAGRPQPGSDQPQLSRNTQKKMENAGLDPSGGNSRNNVADSREGIEELKAQNDQIIELLKRINQRL